MKYEYYPSSAYEKFGVAVYDALVDNFPKTYFVGGMVRDMLLHQKISDIDIATSAQPEQVQNILSAHGIAVQAIHSRYGVISAHQGKIGKTRCKAIEITTLRQDLPARNRYPEVRFIKTARVDSLRRDFTINALYYELRAGSIFDFHKGLVDLKKQQLKFIGAPAKRISEDPLRIIRALRFQIQLGFQLEQKTELAIKTYFPLIQKLSRAKIEAEVSKLSTVKLQNTLRKIINSYPLDA